MDNLRHLWFYFDERFEYLKNLKFIFVSVTYPKNIPPSNNFWEMLETIGIPKRKFYIVDKPTRFSRIYIPDGCFQNQRYTKEYLNLLNRLPTLPSPKNLNIEKVYFSRTQFYSRKDFNEKVIENLFKNQGFTIIYPEKINFLTELAILQNCKIFVATEGSIAHNVLFCKKVEKILILRKARFFTGYQFVVNSFAPHNAEIIFIDAAFSPFFRNRKEWWHGPFFLYETNYLRRYFNLPPKISFPILEFSKYLLCFLDHKLLFWTHPIRAKLKLGTRLRCLFK